jgi:hypothetical protein
MNIHATSAFDQTIESRSLKGHNETDHQASGSEIEPYKEYRHASNVDYCFLMQKNC